MQIKPFDNENRIVELVFWGKVDFEHYKRMIYGLDSQNFLLANDLLPKFSKRSEERRVGKECSS